MAAIKDTIMIVDDEADIRELVGEHLTKRGYATITAENGKEAYELLEKRTKEFGGHHLVTAIISDWVMPGGDGVDFLLKLRKGPYKDIPFILVSGNVSREKLEEAIKLDADGVLLKPLPLAVLSKKIEEALERRLKKDLLGPF